jgi:Putative zinc-finger
MSATSCHVVRESAPDFALGALTGRERAEVVAHLDHCPACQALVGEYASVADGLLELIPEAEPAADLAPSVLETMRPARGPRARRRVAALVAAALVAIGLGTGLTLTLASGGSDGRSTATPALRSAPMLGSGDITVGRVVTTDDRPPTIAVSVDYWLPDGTYELAAHYRPGAAMPLGTLEVVNGRGTWTGGASATDLVAVTLADQSGNVVCEGRLT